MPRALAYAARAARYLTLVVLVSCSGAGDSPTEPAPVTPVASVEVSGVTGDLAVSSSITLTATALSASGTALSGRSVAWSTSDQAIATVAGGVVTGVGAGRATITATIEGKSGTASVTVFIAVARIDVSPPTANLIVGSTLTLTARALAATGEQVAGKTISWSTNDSSRATVVDGVVTGRGVGSVIITAGTDGKTGTASINVIPQPVLALEVVSGDNQRGLTGRPLADSIVVRAKNQSGSVVPGVVISWAASGGAVSDSSTVSNADGLARVQWRAGSGTATLTARSATAAAAVTSIGQQGGACQLSQASRFSLGPTDFSLNLRATQALRIQVLFVDFADAAASETPASLLQSIANPGIDILKELTYGRISVTLVPTEKWYRMSKSIGAYDWHTFAGHKAYLEEALGLANADVDFSNIDAVYVFAPPSAVQANSPTFLGGQSGGVVFDGHTIPTAVTFGNDSRRFGPSILAHETGHMLGLVDLYAFDPAGGQPYQGNQFRFVGAWSLMSNVFTPGHYLAWEKRKLGFVDNDQVDCLDAPGGIETIITPVETIGGLKMVVLPIDQSRALVVETRALTGLDAGLCKAGVLIYEVSSAVASGSGPAVIRGSRTTTSGNAFTRCGPWADATYAAGAGEVSDYSDTANGFSIKVLSAEAGGAFRVRIKR